MPRLITQFTEGSNSHATKCRVSSHIATAGLLHKEPWKQPDLPNRFIYTKCYHPKRPAHLFSYGQIGAPITLPSKENHLIINWHANCF